MLGVYFFLDTSNENIDDVPMAELIAKIEEDNYRVITEDEFISYSLYAEKQNDEKKGEQDKASDKQKDTKTKVTDKDSKSENDNDNEKEEEEVKKVTFTTEAGVVSQDIADILIEKKVIDDRQKFLDYLEDNDYSPYIQLGTFEVTTDMSFKELAETVTTYPGD